MFVQRNRIACVRIAYQKCSIVVDALFCFEGSQTISTARIHFTFKMSLSIKFQYPRNYRNVELG